MWHPNPQARLSGRAAFAAATRGGWRAARRDDAGVLAVGAPATFAVWAAEDLAVQAPDARVAAWSTDPRSGTPGLPRLDPGVPAPECLATVLDGRVMHASDRWTPAGSGAASLVRGAPSGPSGSAASSFPAAHSGTALVPHPGPAAPSFPAAHSGTALVPHPGALTGPPSGSVAP
jgi:hypothetical protein